MKKILLIVSLIFGGLIASAQTTTVTATITDSDSQTWNNGTWQAVLVNAANPNGPFYLDGVQLTTAQLQKSGSMSSSGVITGTFYDVVNHITPNGSFYNFTLCPQASAPCVSGIGASPTGSSINLSTTLSANLKGPRFPATGANAFGYLDIEIDPTPISGGVYYNVTSGFQRIWSGSAWSNNGSGAGGPPTGAAGGALAGTYPNPTLATSYLPLAGGAITGAVTSSSTWNGIYQLSDAQNNYVYNRTLPTTFPITDTFRGESFFAGGAGGAFGTGAAPSVIEEGAIGIGYGAAASAKYLNGAVAIGYDALNSWVGASTCGSECGNMIAIGPFAGQTDNASSGTASPEWIAIGNKAYSIGSGEQGSVMIGTHIIGPSGGTGNVYLGADITNGWGNNTSPSSFVTGTYDVLIGQHWFYAPQTPATYSSGNETLIGDWSGECSWASSYNTIIGAFIAGNTSYTGTTCPAAGSTYSNNVFIGDGETLASNWTAGTYNVVTTTNAGGGLTTGSFNSVYGPAAGYSLGASSYQAMFGYSAGRDFSSSTAHETAIGYDAAYYNVSTDHVTAVGYGAMGNAAAPGGPMTALGDLALGRGTSSDSDVIAIGYYSENGAGRGTVTGTVSIGDYSGNPGGSEDVFIGDQVTRGVSAGTTQNDSTFVGGSSGYSNTASNDTCVGYHSCYEYATGGGNEAIGSGALIFTSVVNAVQLGAGTNSTSNTVQYLTLPVASTATFSVSGCGTAGSLTGSGLAGTFTAGATSCTPVITTGVTAPHGFVCDMHDWTTPLDLLVQASATTTTATFGTATVVSADVIAFKCAAY